MLSFTEKLTALRGQHALITGGSKGFGAAIAKTFAAAGMNIAIVGRDISGLEHVKAEINKQYDVDCLIIQADLANETEVQSIADKAYSHADRWDILINNAGYFKRADLVNLSLEDFDYIQTVNLRSALQLSQLMAPQMIARKSGKIIHISSIASFVGVPAGIAYAISKAGINQLTRSMAVELGAYNINVNAICPGPFLTDMLNKPEHAELRAERLKQIPMKRFGEVEEIADLALFLASSSADFINGAIIPIDGGFLCMP